MYQQASTRYCLFIYDPAQYASKLFLFNLGLKAFACLYLFYIANLMGAKASSHIIINTLFTINSFLRAVVPSLSGKGESRAVISVHFSILSIDLKPIQSIIRVIK